MHLSPLYFSNSVYKLYSGKTACVPCKGDTPIGERYTFAQKAEMLALIKKQSKGALSRFPFNPPEDGGSALQTPRRSGTTGFKKSIDQFFANSIQFFFSLENSVFDKRTCLYGFNDRSEQIIIVYKKSNQKRKIGEIIAVLYS